MDLPVYIGKSKTLGGIRAVLAARTIQKGELIEICPIILIPKKEWNAIDTTVLGHYNYAWTRSQDCIVLGYCGLVNHSYTPTAKYVRNFAASEMQYKAIRTIAKDEEITVNYNGDPKNRDPLHPDYEDGKR